MADPQIIKRVVVCLSLVGGVAACIGLVLICKSACFHCGAQSCMQGVGRPFQWAWNACLGMFRLTPKQNLGGGIIVVEQPRSTDEDELQDMA